MTYLAEHDVSLSELPRRESFAITKRWTSIFGRFTDGSPHLHSSKAVTEWLQTTETNLILLMLSSRIDAFPITTNHRSNSAYEFNGNAIDLSQFHDLEFAVFPVTYDWTLVHTHEDGAMGGPYFIRANQLSTEV